MLEGLKQALNSSMARIALRIYICLNNLRVACNAGGILKSSSKKFLENLEI